LAPWWRSIKRADFLTLLALENCQSNSSISMSMDLDDIRPEQVDVVFNQYRAQFGSLRIFVDSADSIKKWNRVARHFQMLSDLPRLRKLWVCSTE
jgi:hypothetical protein